MLKHKYNDYYLRDLEKAAEPKLFGARFCIQACMFFVCRLKIESITIIRSAEKLELPICRPLITAVYRPQKSTKQASAQNGIGWNSQVEINP